MEATGEEGRVCGFAHKVFKITAMQNVREFLKEYAPIIRMYGLHPCRVKDMKTLMEVDNAYKIMVKWVNPEPERKENTK